ncbi:DNA-binding protein [Saxibacter everestensis]|uniref:DNA-binding protein n=1 Tax=Saxibacter everestensis TaxID=2909229 RepID=A0ABY8QWN2_9MICO|nr:DNA-binding protein [Brevibacteriaceae bacterium ZFBP1038]
MEGKHELSQTSGVDHMQMQREREAQGRLLELGADEMERRPWRPAPAPPTAVDLTQFALWRSADLDPDDLLTALALLPAARTEVEGVEIGLLFTARNAGLTWAQIAEATGFRSPQACQQYYTRLNARQSESS